ncbi:MAG: hypothetical protein M1480_12770 [Bacteroidetes bacterium]|nr:hypothetical protein [Bacteroidota bacterium]
MKKIFIIIFISAISLFAQENNKGRISLVFNGGKIDLPINTVTIMKQNNIIISVRAEHNDSTSQQMVSLELGFRKLSTEGGGINESFRIDINVRDNSKLSGKDLSVWWFDYNKDPLKEKEAKESAHYGVFNKGERVSWEINTLSLRINATKIIYDGNNLKIIGEFSGTFRSTLAKDKEISEIKDGKFEIII